MENKPANSLVVSLGKVLNGMPLPLSSKTGSNRWQRSSVDRARE